MLKRIGLLVVPMLALATTIQAEDEDGWSVYRSEDYGFGMLSPTKLELEEKEWKGGWAGFEGEYEGMRLYAIAKTEKVTPEEIEKFGVKISKIGEDHWTLIDEGEDDENGWAWYRAYKASHDGKVAYAGLGVGPKGSYLLMITTSDLDDAIYADDYAKWYTTLSVF
jgi:hypothetical protein